ncbi:hypothetical protein COEREDRAFT_94467 [Coemansia reversa NRRL 1564]|uniref:Uncharacterized protein n=1 Tax=Coemansia reversa (strain ATCC 12441 / NRRL 1564) TaxID=763665 RepID=A0A2G5B3V6_COERN|nr:hypothetical protein COEREDRAFT_94467 [Coemansia reversa NRRL 1564]|eukprot:PIA13675.1 hypothetical protein COEREDRAFT_94467 [Coemansia reversa NRRL 1564]
MDEFPVFFAIAHRLEDGSNIAVCNDCDSFIKVLSEDGKLEGKTARESVLEGITSTLGRIDENQRLNIEAKKCIERYKETFSATPEKDCQKLSRSPSFQENKGHLSPVECFSSPRQPNFKI